MKYGYFDKKTREYVITRPDTPTAWINYLGSDEYCALISNTAGGYSFHKDPKDKRISRYRYNNVPGDRPGRYIYVRDNDKEDYWSATWQPVMKPLAGKSGKGQSYECRHGMSYTSIKSEYDGIATETTFFVPLKENLEAWVFTVKNNSRKARDLSIFTYLEFCLWQAIMDMTDFQYTLNISKALCEKDGIYHLTGYFPNVGRNDFAYFASSEKIKGFDSDREAFLGNCNSESNPLAVTRGKSFNSVNSGGNPIASVWNKIKLKPGEEKTVTFILGASDDKKEADEFIAKYRLPENARDELARLKEYWNKYFENYVVATPDENVNLMVNTWNQYQCRTTFNWSRSASYYESGIGRGMGFRDSNQDTLGVVHTIPDRVKTRICELLENQFENGSTYHQFFPLTKKGEKGGYSDDPLWLLVSVSGYIKETGDTAFLNENVKFTDSGTATVYEHLKRAVDYVASQAGPHGFPLIGFADWNDCLNLMGKNKAAESVWVAQFLVLAAKELADIAKLQAKSDDAGRYSALADEMKNRINKTAWDGDWYVRAYDDDGNPVGSSTNTEGRIDLLTQAWAVMAGIADDKRSVKCMDMVKKHLDSKHGIMLIAPPYTSYDTKIGAVGTFAPGLKENGGIFCHANPWGMIAETMLGRGDQAFEYYKKIAPAFRNDIADIHKTEPYVYAQYLAGEAHPAFGRGRNSWLTGSAAWNLVAITSYILGVRPDYDGLIIDPCIPKKWKGFTVKRVFRHATYEIEVKNPKGVSKGVKSLMVDGKKVEGNKVPVFKDKGIHKVEVLMGQVEHKCTGAQERKNVGPQKNRRSSSNERITVYIDN
ncbi:MAG: glycosyl transferase [Candidatus Omnitrophota bacterium]